MATGIVKEYKPPNPASLDLSASNGSGIITQDIDGSDIGFVGELPTGINVGDPIQYDVDDSVDPKMAINLRPVSSEEPADKGEVKTGMIEGDLDVGSDVYTLKGVTLNGNVTVNGGQLIIKGNSIINGDVDFKGGTTLEVYNSTIKKDLKFKNGSDCRVINSTTNGDLDVKSASSLRVDNSTTNGDLDVKNTSESIVINSTTNGDLDVKNCSSASVTNSNIGGDLELKNNVSCDQSNNTVTGTNHGCIN